MRPLAIIIMDGFGISSEKKGNAIAKAKKPNIERIWKNFATTNLECSGYAVGLPKGQMGNSEVGHLNLGSGRIVYQDLTKINLALEEGKLGQNPVLAKSMQKAKKGKLHLLGLLSDGGVHSHITHLYALLDMAKDSGPKNVYIHAILDGRDVPPKSALTYIQETEEKIKKIEIGKIATIAGRYYTMDRDKRWDRVEKAYKCLTEGDGFYAGTPAMAVLDGYERGESDEFLKPTIVDANGLVEPKDSIIFFNFRPDRAREITRAFIDNNFVGFARKPIEVHFTCMTQYDVALDAAVAFPPDDIKNTLGEVVSRANLKQLRIAETEKYAHVTYFFNGGVETPNPQEDRELIPSPKVATYDLKPEMSAYEVTDEVIKRIRSKDYDLIILNYANPDMVGHTGIFDATVMAIEAVDECVGRVVEEILRHEGIAFLTADHGNAEKMTDNNGNQPHTAHTTNLVPFSYIINNNRNHKLRDDGILADVAPTALELLEISKPSDMTGKSLIVY